MVFGKGDLVMVNIPEDADVPFQMRQYNCQTMKVADTSKSKAKIGGYCMLEGAVSDLGGQFVFMNEWLHKVHDL